MYITKNCVDSDIGTFVQNDLGYSELPEGTPVWSNADQFNNI